MEVKKIGVAGFGLMGGGIVQVSAQAGYDVVVLETKEEYLEKGFKVIEKNLAKAVAKNKLSDAEAGFIQARITGTTDIKELASCDFIIEAIIENLELKQELFSELDKLCPAHTIFASNTSSMQIIEMAAATNRPEQFVGMHFFNPVPLMKLVEIIRTIQSNDASVQVATKLAESFGKVPIQAKDRAGFIVNLLLVPYLLDAIRALEAGVGTKEDIDTGMVLGCGYPMGPLTLLDLVGLDTIYFVSGIMFDEFKDPKYSAPPLLKQMVNAGFHGRKSGKGFYDYTQK